MAKVGYGVSNAMYVVENDEIESLPQELLEALDCGDTIIKCTLIDGKVFKHLYKVSFKADGVGLCFTYTACGYIETISYDKTDGVWVFNSKDVWQAE